MHFPLLCTSQNIYLYSIIDFHWHFPRYIWRDLINFGCSREKNEDGPSTNFTEICFFFRRYVCQQFHTLWQGHNYPTFELSHVLFWKGCSVLLSVCHFTFIYVMMRVQNIHERHEPITYHDAGHFIELSWATNHDVGRVLSCPGQLKMSNVKAIIVLVWSGIKSTMVWRNIANYIILREGIKHCQRHYGPRHRLL